MIVIPMAGESRRFREAGFGTAKHALPLSGRTLFSWSVGSFHHYFSKEPFLFIMLRAQNTADFVRSQIAQMGIATAHIVELSSPTAGQASTVEKGLQSLGSRAWGGPITIFNIDTIRINFRAPTDAVLTDSAGYLEVFRGPGEHWSFVEPGEEQLQVAKTAEKQRISDLCCTGLYQFDSVDLFSSALAAQRAMHDGGLVKGEEYIAPIYNRLIEQGHDIRYRLINRSDVEFSGTPAEYADLRRRWETTPHA